MGYGTGSPRVMYYPIMSTLPNELQILIVITNYYPCNIRAIKDLL